jgi:hypothetical protein
MENAIERMAGISFLAIGLSHLLRPHDWVEYFAQVRAKGAPGAFMNGMVSRRCDDPSGRLDDRCIDPIGD